MVFVGEKMKKPKLKIKLIRKSCPHQEERVEMALGILIPDELILDFLKKNGNDKRY